MKIYSGTKKKNRNRETDVHDYHGARWVKATAKALRSADRREAKKRAQDESRPNR